jgi:hypothetical protein
MSLSFPLETVAVALSAPGLLRLFYALVTLSAPPQARNGGSELQRILKQALGVAPAVRPCAFGDRHEAERPQPGQEQDRQSARAQPHPTFASISVSASS